MDISDYVLPEKDYEAIFQVLEDTNVSIAQLITALLTEKCFKNHSALADLLGNAGTIIAKLLGHRRVSEAARDQACAVVERIYASEIEGLVKVNAGWHFSARQTAPDDIEDFAWDELVHSFVLHAPRLWSLLDGLLLARKRKSSLILDRDAMLVDTPVTHLENEQDVDEMVLEGNHSPPEQLPTVPRKQKFLNIVR